MVVGPSSVTAGGDDVMGSLGNYKFGCVELAQEHSCPHHDADGRVPLSSQRAVQRRTEVVRLNSPLQQ